MCHNVSHKCGARGLMSSENPDFVCWCSFEYRTFYSADGVVMRINIKIPKRKIMIKNNAYLSFSFFISSQIFMVLIVLFCIDSYKEMLPKKYPNHVSCNRKDEEQETTCGVFREPDSNYYAPGHYSLSGQASSQQLFM